MLSDSGCVAASHLVGRLGMMVDSCPMLSSHSLNEPSVLSNGLAMMTNFDTTTTTTTITTTITTTSTNIVIT